MFFKHASIYELESFNLSLIDFEERLSKRRFKSINDDDVISVGIEHLLFDDSENVVHAVNDCFFFKYVKATRTVPKDQLAALIERRVTAAEEAGKTVTREYRSDIADIAHAELLRVQPAKHLQIGAYVDIKRQLLIVNHKSDSQCEDVILEVRKALGSFRCAPIYLNMKPCDYMNDWIALSADEYRIPNPAWLNFDFDGTIKGRGETDKNMVTSKGNAIDKSSFDGLSIVSCDLDKFKTHDNNELEHVVSFTLISLPNTAKKHNTDLKLTKLGFCLDAEPEGDDEADYYNAELYVMTAELGILIEDLSITFGGRAGLMSEDAIASELKKALATGNGNTIFLSEIKNAKERDPLFSQAKEFISETRRSSVSGIQRKFKIGYNRASRIADDLEQAGFISAPNNAGVREVLIAPPEAK